MNDPWAHFASLPSIRLLLLFLTVATFVIGGNLLSYAHCRRVGRPWRFFGNVFAEIVRFNRKEWLALAGVIAATFGLFAIALRVG